MCLILRGFCDLILFRFLPINCPIEFPHIMAHAKDDAKPGGKKCPKNAQKQLKSAKNGPKTSKNGQKSTFLQVWPRAH